MAEQDSMDGHGLRRLGLHARLGGGFRRTFAALTLVLLGNAPVPAQDSGPGEVGIDGPPAEDNSWEETWQELARRLFDESWRDEAGLGFLLEVSGPRVGQGEEQHDWACEVAAPRLYEILREDASQDPEVLIELLHLGRAGSLARGKLDLLAWPTLEAAKLMSENGSLDAALAHIEETRTALPADHPHQLSLLRRSALLSSEHGRFQAALAVLDDVERMIEQGHGEPYADHANARDRAAILLRMGLIDLAAREIDRARRGLEEAFSAGLAVKGPLVNAYCTLVHIYLTQSRFDEVIQESGALLRKHAALFEERPGGRATMLFNAALAHELSSYRDPAHVDPAQEHFEGVLAIPQASQEQRSRSRIGLARLATRTGDPGAALARLGQVRATTGLSVMISAELEAAAARAALTGGEPPEQLRQRREELAAALRRVYDEISSEAPRRGGIGFLGYRAYRVVLATLIELHLSVEGAESPEGTRAVLESLFEAQKLHSLARFVEAGGFSAADVQTELVPPQGGILVFFPAEDGCHVLAVDAQRLVHGRTRGILDVREACAPFVALLRRSPADLEGPERERRQTEIRAQSEALFELLIPAEVRPLLAEWSQVVFVGGDYLRGLPLECLAERGGEPLGLTKAVSHIPALPLGLHLRGLTQHRASLTPPLDLVLVGDAVHGTAARSRYREQVEFQMSPRERQQLTSPFDGARVASLLGDRATLEELERLAPNRTRLLHLVTHGIRDHAREASRGLLLSSTPEHDGLLFDRDVERLAPSDFVVLSSCSSAQGPWRGGDEKSATLVGAFLRNGATGVLSTPSEVELTPALRLGATFHDRVARGVSPAEGLRQARNELVDAGFDDPFYYGLVQITGAGHSALFPQRAAAWKLRPTNYLVAAGLLTGALALLASRLRRRPRRRAA